MQGVHILAFHIYQPNPSARAVVASVIKAGTIRIRVRWVARVFFFQAEDGIRDYKVTGVQTCALPIWAERTGAQFAAQGPGADPGAVVFDALQAARARGVDVMLADTAGRLHSQSHLMEIGRASCRERG